MVMSQPSKISSHSQTKVVYINDEEAVCLNSSHQMVIVISIKAVVHALEE
jgi:hypothetical protein